MLSAGQLESAAGIFIGRSREACTAPDSLLVERFDLLGHVLNVGGGQLCVNGDAQDLFGCSFGVWKAACTITEIAEAVLQVKGLWVVDLRVNTALAQPGCKLVSAGQC